MSVRASGHELQHVFSDVAIGPLKLPHRVVMGSMHVGLEAADDDGRALAAFYAERAAAGVALIVTGGCAVSRVGAGGRSYAFVNEDASASALARVADAVHAVGGRILLQLFHAGRYAFERSFGLRPVAPSAVYSPFSRAEPRALSGSELRAVIDEFSAGARRATELGYDGVELMGSEGYLLNQFTAPATNLRDDEWGGDPERRRAFPVAVARAVRDAVGTDGAVVYRLSGADLVDGGTPHEELLELAVALAGDGLADALNVGIGWHEARVPTVQLLVPYGAWLPWTRAVRGAVSIPVIASNRINTLIQADAALAAGDADLISLARPFLADPELIARARDGHAVNVCIGCDQACIDRSIFDRRVSCIVNPRAGHELEHSHRRGRPAASAAVAVVGGGPAGMAAARSLALTGAAVTLYEADERIGGQFRMACRIPGKQDYERTIEYFESELVRLGVDVRLSAPVSDSESLTGFDAVVVATGVRPRPVQLAGAELDHVISYAELLRRDAAPPEGPVAIIGAGGIGIDVAHLLSHAPGAVPLEVFYARYGLKPPGRSVAAPTSDARGRAVTLMRRGGRIGERVGPSTRWAVLAELRLAGVTMLTGVTYERIEPGIVHVRDADGEPLQVPAETVVVAAGQLRQSALGEQLRVVGADHIVIGGAADAAELDAERAFREGLEAADRVGRLIGSRG